MSDETLTTAPRRGGAPLVVSYRELTAIREAIVRLDTKMDALLELKGPIDDLEKRVTSIEIEMAKTGASRGVVVWAVNAAMSIAAAIIGAAAALWFN